MANELALGVVDLSKFAGVFLRVLLGKKFILFNFNLIGSKNLDF